MTGIPATPTPMPNQAMSPDDFNLAIQALFDFFPQWKAAVEKLGPEVAAMVDAKNYVSGSVYNLTGFTAPSFVYGSDGITYVCIGENVTGDNPVGSVTGNWQRITVDVPPRLAVPDGELLTSDIIGGASAKTGDHEVTVNALSCWDENNSDEISCASQVVTIPEVINQVYHLFSCSDGVVRTDTDESGANLSTYTKRWIGFVLNDASGVVIAFVHFGNRLFFDYFQDVPIITGINGTYLLVDPSTVLPTARIHAIEYGQKQTGDNTSVWVSYDGGSTMSHESTCHQFNYPSIGWINPVERVMHCRSSTSGRPLNLYASSLILKR